MKIGIIGAENSHTAAIANTINNQQAVPGFSVDYVWGETAEYAKAAAEKGNIPHIVADPTDMLGKVDAVAVDHRHPKYHLPAVEPFVAAGIPTFIDKPFCYRSAEGKKFLELAKSKGTPVTSFSVIPHQQSFHDFQDKLAGLGEIVTGTTYGPCDIDSQWGGIFFYGIHQMEVVLKAFGYNVESVLVTRHQANGTAQIFYDDGKIITMNLVKEGATSFWGTAIGKDGYHSQEFTRDENSYLSGIQTFCKMFETGEEPVSYEHMLAPVQVLEALERSVASGNCERVEV